MKTSLQTIIGIILIVMFNWTSAMASASQPSKKKPSAKITHSKQSKSENRLKQNVSFDEHAVGGKYQVPLESTTVVEDEKSLDNLIGVRQNFKDREQVSQELR